MDKPEHVVSIHGVPRSGTSWLAQIFNSHEKVALRFQPLFAYRFKDRLNLNSSSQEIASFIQELWECQDDDFIHTKDHIADGIHPEFAKRNSQTHLVMKMVRYHHLIELLMERVDGLKVIGLVRNPLAVINSWLQAPKEFKRDWDPLKEWRFAEKKNAGRIEEFNGFEKWKEVASLFQKLERESPDNFRLLRYEELVKNADSAIESIFNWLSLDLTPETQRFISESQTQHNDDPYAVFKDPSQHDRWRRELDKQIITEIENDLCGTDLERFLA